MKPVYKLLILVSITAPAAFFTARYLLSGKYPRITVSTSSDNVYQQVTGDISEDDRSRWDEFFDTQTYVYGKEPSAFLVRHVAQLPVGRVLDIAMSEGRNGVYLAKKGFLVDGVDISVIALRKARRLARENRVSINAINADLRDYTISPNTYDVILNIHYLQRGLVPRIKQSLKPGGFVVFENYTVDQLRNPRGQSLPRDQVLETGELKELFHDFEIIQYEETNANGEAVARLLARKPKGSSLNMHE